MGDDSENTVNQNLMGIVLISLGILLVSGAFFLGWQPAGNIHQYNATKVYQNQSSGGLVVEDVPTGEKINIYDTEIDERFICDGDDRLSCSIHASVFNDREEIRLQTSKESFPNNYLVGSSGVDKVVINESGYLEYEKVEAETAMGKVSMPIHSIPEESQKVIEKGSMKTRSELPYQNTLIEKEDENTKKYFMIRQTAGKEMSNIQAIIGLLDNILVFSAGIFLILRGQRTRIES